MKDNYAKIAVDNLNRLYNSLPPDLALNIPAKREGDGFAFKAFGETCLIRREGVSLGGKSCPSVLSILISLYALNARPDICITEPLKAFKEFPNSMPYVGAFTTHTEQVLVSNVPIIKTRVDIITETLDGEKSHEGMGGDFSFMVFPLPKIALCYIIYEADDDFPASVTCLYSHNADLFLPMDALADVGEYTSKCILKVLQDKA